MDNSEEVKPMAFIDDGDMKLLASSDKRHYVSVCNEPTASCKNPLYAAPPAPANALSIVQVALEAAVNSVLETRDRSGINSDGGGWIQRASKSDFVRSIRAIPPQSVIDSMEGES